MASLLKHPEIFTPTILQSFGGIWSLLWDFVEYHSRASLEMWLVFALSYRSFLPRNPIYTIDLDDSDLPHLSNQLLQCPWQLPFGVKVVVEYGGTLNSAAALQLVSIPNLYRLDLHSAQVTKASIRILRQSIEYGALTRLRHLCLPRQGPPEIKSILDRPWPTSLEYLETPRKPGPAWYVSAKTFPKYAIQFLINAPPHTHRSRAYRPHPPNTPTTNLPG